MKRKAKQSLGKYLRCFYKLHHFFELLEMVTKVLKAAKQVVKNCISRNKETNKKFADNEAEGNLSFLDLNNKYEENNKSLERFRGIQLFWVCSK